MTSFIDYSFFFTSILLFFLIFLQNQGNEKKNIDLLNYSKLNNIEKFTLLNIGLVIFFLLIKSENI